MIIRLAKPEKLYEPLIDRYTNKIKKAKTPLVAAARKGNIEIAKMLFAVGAKITFHAKWDETPLMAAARFGHTGFAKLLLNKGADLNKT